MKICVLDGLSGAKDCIIGVTSFLSECDCSRYRNRSVILNLNLKMPVNDFLPGDARSVERGIITLR